MSNDWNNLPPAAPADGLTDNVAGGLAYITIIPAILFLVLAPYNRRPFVRFHSFQCLFLFGAGIVANLLHVIPIIGTVIGLLLSLAITIFWRDRHDPGLHGQEVRRPRYRPACRASRQQHLAPHPPAAPAAGVLSRRAGSVSLNDRHAIVILAISSAAILKPPCPPKPNSSRPP